jgi:DNA invertase Pin-like site-specific DNA recombinase
MAFKEIVLTVLRRLAKRGTVAKSGVSFVSITQQFNTTTSMGRLTLNVLLSFAQFEREVTGERIRDKIAASKKKGMWMGGMPPLGYDVKNRKLVVNDAEACIVVEIYRRYLALKSVHALRDERGRTHTVTVTEDGFEYAGTSYPSLTKIAKKITGAHWSGPRFFGLPVASAERPSHGARDG